MKLTAILSQLSEIKKLASKYKIERIKVHNISLDDLPPDESNPFPLLVYEKDAQPDDDFGSSAFEIALENLLGCKVNAIYHPAPCYEESSVNIDLDNVDRTREAIVSLFNSDRKANESEITADNIEFCNLPKISAPKYKF